MQFIQSYFLLSREVGLANNKDKDVSLAAVVQQIKQQAQQMGIPEVSQDELNSNSLIVSIGGDGTALRAMKLSANTGAKILAIQGGHLGFLTDVPANEAQQAFVEAVTGQRQPEARLVLEHTNPAGQVVLAGNEFTFADKHTGTFHYWSFSSGSFQTLSFSADAIMLVTPTGSTAYNLSAGGAIVHPATPAVQISAVAPVSLAFRSGIVPVPVEGINLCATARRDSVLVLRNDGNFAEEYSVKEGDLLSLNIKASQHQAVFLRKADWSYFDVVSHKLGWGKVPGLL